MFLLDSCMMLIKMTLTLSVLYSNHPNTFVLAQEKERSEFQSDISDLDFGYSTVINYIENDFSDVDYEDEFLVKTNQPFSFDEEQYRYNNDSPKEFERDLRAYRLEEEVDIKRSQTNSLNSAVQNRTQEGNITSTENRKNQDNGSRLAIHNVTQENNITSTENRKNQDNGSRLAIHNVTQENNITSTENRKNQDNGSRLAFHNVTQENITSTENRKNQANSSNFAIQLGTKDNNLTSTENRKNLANGVSFASQFGTNDGNITSTENRKNPANSSNLAIQNIIKGDNVPSTEVDKNQVNSSSLTFQKGVAENTITPTENSKSQVSSSSLAIQNEVDNIPSTEEEKKCMHENITCSKCSSLSPHCHYHHKEKKCFYSKVVHGNDIYECGARYFAQDGWMPLIAAVGVVGVATLGVVVFVAWEVYRRCIKKHAIPQEETEEMRSQIAGIRARRCNTPELMLKLGKILAETDPETQK